jgi:hypothetical protein
VENSYNDMEMTVLNNTFTDIYFYDYYKMEKTTLRNNSAVTTVLYLIMKKYILGLDITNETTLEDFFIPLKLAHDLGVFEISYYSQRNKMKYYTKGITLNKDLILTNIHRKTHKKFLYATLNDKVNVTDFINDHLSSFHDKNNISVLDLTLILYISQHQIPHIDETHHYLKLVDDDTLEETIFDNHSNIVLVKNE